MLPSEIADRYPPEVLDLAIAILEKDEVSENEGSG